jgi:hypothetical protein
LAGQRQKAHFCDGKWLACRQASGGPPPRSSPPTDGNEKSTLVRKSTDPSKLCQPSLKTPVVFGSSEQLLRVLTQNCARISAQVFDAIFRKPALDLGQGVTMLLGMLILVPYPFLASCRIALSRSRSTGSHGINRYPDSRARKRRARRGPFLFVESAVFDEARISWSCPKETIDTERSAVTVRVYNKCSVSRGGNIQIVTGLCSAARTDLEDKRLAIFLPRSEIDAARNWSTNSETNEKDLL